jgi:hypothetical protein
MKRDDESRMGDRQSVAQDLFIRCGDDRSIKCKNGDIPHNSNRGASHFTSLQKKVDSLHQGRVDKIHD